MNDRFSKDIFTEIGGNLEKVFNRVLKDVDEIFDDKFPDFSLKNPVMRFRTDIKETNENYIIEAELPGFNKSDVEITTSNNHLVIKAKREEIKEENSPISIRKERYYGNFQRTFEISDMDTSEEGLVNLKAKYENGILTVSVPKIKVEKKENKINIE